MTLISQSLRQRSATVLTSIQNSASAVPAVTVDEFKQWSKIDGDEEDEIITLILQSCTEAAEQYTRRRIISTSWSASVATFSTLRFDSSSVNVSDIQITYFDETNTLQVLPESYYKITSDDYDTFIEFNEGVPDITERPDAITITYSAGYGPNCPARIKIGILKMAASYFENRQDLAQGVNMISQYSHTDWFPFKLFTNSAY